MLKIFSFLQEGDDEVSKEEKKHTAMEKGYNFVWGKDKKKENS